MWPWGQMGIDYAAVLEIVFPSPVFSCLPALSVGCEGDLQWVPSTSPHSNPRQEQYMRVHTRSTSRLSLDSPRDIYDIEMSPNCRNYRRVFGQRWFSDLLALILAKTERKREIGPTPWPAKTHGISLWHFWVWFSKQLEKFQIQNNCLIIFNSENLNYV